jgi:Tfp pilus assembly protein PilO
MNFEFNGQTFNLRYLTHTRRFLLYTVGLVAVGVVLLIFLIFPQAQAAFNKNSDLQKQQQQLEQLRVKEQQLQSLSQSDLFRNVNQINQLLPSKKPLLELLSAFYEVASIAGVSYSDLSLSPGLISQEEKDLTQAQTQATSKNRKTAKGPVSGVESLSVNLKVAGDLPQINQFLNQIENVAPITTITKLKLNERKISADSETTNFEAELEVETYFFSQIISSSLNAPIPSLSTTQQILLNEISDYRYPELVSRDIITGGASDPFNVNESAFILTE